MTIAIRQIHPVFVGEVSGIDIARPLSRDEVAAVEAGMDRYAVLVFHDQKLTDEQQMAFSRNFGALEDARGGNITKPEDRRLEVGMNDVSNLGRDGRPLDRASRVRLFNLGNMLWHSDSSFRAIPAKYSLLSARVVNPIGGNTEFADMRAAYDELDAATKALIEDLVCEHSLMYSRGSLGMLDYSDEERATFRPVRQRLVRTHPVSGRKSLYLSSHAGGIVGMPMPEARILLRDLTEHATQPRFVYVHTWRPWDLVMWDNRQMMHRVRRYDESQPRDMRRTTVAGDAPTVGGGGLTPRAPHGPPADLPRSPDRAGHHASRAGHGGGGRGLPDHRHPADGHAERGRPSLRHSARRAAPAGDHPAPGRYGSVRARHGVPALRARAPRGDPRGIPRGLGAARARGTCSS